MPMRIRNFRIEWLIFGVFSCVLAAISILDMLETHDLIAERERDRLDAAATVTGYMIEDQLKKVGATLENIRDSYMPAGSVDIFRDEGALISARNRLRILAGAMTSIHALAIADESGAIVVSNIDGNAGQRLDESESFAALRQHPDPDVLYLGRPYTSRQGTWTFDITRCIVDSQGSFTGVVTASVDPDFFSALMKAVLYAPDAWCRLVHGEGTIYMWEPGGRDKVGTNLAVPGTLFSQHLESGRQSSLLEGKSSSAKSESMAAMRTIHPESLDLRPPLVLSIGREKTAIFAEWSRDAQNSGLVTTVLLLTGASILYVSQRWRRFARLESERMGTQLRSTQAALESFFSISPDLLAIADHGGVCRKLNPSWERAMGYASANLEGRPCLDLFHPEDLPAVREVMSDVASGRDISGFVARFRHKDGSYRFLEWSAAGQDGLIYAAAHDITERREAERHLHDLAYHDRLTGLPNRTLFFDRLSQALSGARRARKHVAILFIDLDGFKKVNDEHGHDAGDTVLKTVAGRFRETVRATDTVARMGGDEFVVILHELESRDDAVTVANKLLAAVASEIPLDGRNPCRVGASIGISIYPEHGTSMDALLMAADAAMYRSKKKGRNRFVFAGEGQPDETEITLDESCILGVRELDDQHREMVGLVNRLCRTLRDPESAELVGDSLFKLLLAFTEYHFATESRLMLQHKYPAREEHDADHDRLLRDLGRFGPVMHREGDRFLADYLREWVMGHILRQDKPLAEFLRDHASHGAPGAADAG